MYTSYVYTRHCDVVWYGCVSIVARSQAVEKVAVGEK